MELDELKQAWQVLDRRLERQNQLNLALLRESRLPKARALLRPLVWGQALQVLAGVALALAAVVYWLGQLGTPHLLIPGVLLQAYGLLFIVLGGRELHLLRMIDYAVPVVEIQRRLGLLRRRRIINGRIFGAVGCLAWVPLIVVASHALWGVDLIAQAPLLVAILTASAAVCLLLFSAVYGWLRVLRHTPLAQRIDESSVGHSLRRAEAALTEIADFERE